MRRRNRNRETEIRECVLIINNRKINYHNLGILKQSKFILSQFWNLYDMEILGSSAPSKESVLSLLVSSSSWQFMVAPWISSTWFPISTSILVVFFLACLCFLHANLHFLFLEGSHHGGVRDHPNLV